MSYEVKLQDFEGPLDLLLYLIQKNEVDIYNIPIVQITDQYLEYVMRIGSLNLEVAGEFLLMAATLIYLKSKMLLPQPPSLEDELAPEDPRRELVERLVEYKKYKEAAQVLAREEDRLFNQFTHRPQIAPNEPIFIDPEMALYQLLTAFYDLYKRRPEESSLAIQSEELDINQSMVEILDHFEERESLTLGGILGQGKTLLQMISYFLALLELIRRGLLKVRQFQQFGEIWISPVG